MVVGVITTLLLFSGGPIGAISFAQQQTTAPGPKIEWLNPDAETSNEISAKDDTSGSTTSASYHLVATVTSLPATPTVVFRYRSGSSAPTDIGTATAVGSDTYEFHWAGNSMPPDAPYDLIASLRSSGSEIASDTEAVVVNNTANPGTGGLPNPDPTTNQSETVEITSPANGGSLNFTDPAGDPRFTATIQVKHSSGVTELTPYYTVSAPGTEPTWKKCEGGSETAEESANGVSCELTAPDFPTQVTGIAVVATDDPTAPAPEPGPDKESGDAHRVNPVGGPTPTASSTSPSPTASTPSPTQTSATPSPSESSASPSPSASTPPPPIAYSSQTTIDYNGKAFTGTVKSDLKKCRRGRDVILKKETPGTDKKLGSDETNRQGEYKIREPNAEGTYYTVAKAKGFTDNFGRPVTCGQDRSKKKRV